MIFTIGYSTRTLPEFLYELQRRRITQLIDVRSSPWSRNAPFNAPQIESWAEQGGIFFKRCGAILGGKANIALDHSSYLKALDYLLSAASREPLAIMCAEGDPTICHRTSDIGASLLVRHGVIARSILRNGLEEDITDTLARVRPSMIRPEIREALDAQASLFPYL